MNRRDGVTPHRFSIALLHNARPASCSAAKTEDAFEEFDSPETVAAIVAALRELGVTVQPVEADAELPWRLRSGGFDFVFNVAEGRGRRCREGIPAAVCELLRIPFTGSDMLTLAVTLDKAAARRLVSPEVPVARAILVDGELDPDSLDRLAYPAVVKPNDEGSSKGIRRQSVATNPATATDRVRWLQENYQCPVLVEEFLAGPEITVGVAGNGQHTRILGAMEIAPVVPAADWIYSLEEKRNWQRRVRYHVPPRLEPAKLAEVEHLALTAYRLLGCRDIARLDFRLHANGVPHFLECNPLPGLHPESGDIAILSRPKLAYAQLVQGVLLDAARRCQVRVNGHA